MSIRVIAICIFRQEDRILGFDVPDDVKGVVGFRPLGGGVEPGETSREAIIREIREELRAEITGVNFLGVLENIFTYLGAPGHEVVFVYEAKFADSGLYEQEVLHGREATGDPLRAVWRPLSEFRLGRIPLYPEGVLRLLEAHSSLA